MSPSKLSEAAETAKLHKLTLKLAKRQEEKEQNKQKRDAQVEREIADLQAQLKSQASFVARYHEERRAEYEKDPTDPRNMAWKKKQEAEERLSESRWARIQNNLKEVGIVLSTMAGAFLGSLLSLVVLLIALPFAVIEYVVRALCCCAS